jgi:hypothetical protein
MATQLPNIPRADFATSTDILRMAMLANQTVFLIGDPGIGKSALIEKVGREIDYPVHTLLGSTLDPTDVGGLPVRRPDSSAVDRIPLAVIHDAAQRPCLLFLDELSAAPPAVQAAFLRLILERKAGDVTLHPETRVVAAANPPDQAPAGFELSAPLMGRASVVHLRPREEEILDHLATLGDDSDSAGAFERALRDEALLFAAVANALPEILQIDIPTDCVTGGQPWGAPRSWERAIRARAAAVAMGMDGLSNAVFTITAGSVGVRQATSYSGVLRMITELPTVDEIVADPASALLPTERVKQVAALGLMPRIAQANLWAAYIYAARMTPEFALAAHKILMPLAKYQPALTDPLTVAGSKARASLSALVRKPSAMAFGSK